MSRAILVGIVGGICTGKSTVAGEFAKAGVPVISGDVMGHLTLEDEGVVKSITSKFGKGIITSEGRVDRTKLSDIVFSDRNKLRMLNDIIARPIIEGISRKISETEGRGDELIVVDAALIYEWGIEENYDIIIMMIAHSERRLRWVIERFNIDNAGAKRRLEIHREIENRILLSKRLPDYIISNDGDLSLLRERAKSIIKEVILLSELYSKGLVKDIGRAQNKGLQRKVRKNPRA